MFAAGRLLSKFHKPLVLLGIDVPFHPVTPVIFISTERFWNISILEFNGVQA